MRVIALFRVSTEKQAETGASLDAQQRSYREQAERHGWTTLAEFRGQESAVQAAADRRVLQDVLRCVREQEPDAVWVYEQSRLTRGDELEVALLMRELKERRTKIVVNGVVRDLSSIDERFMVGIQSLVDRAESERIKERMGRGKKEKARQGKKNSGPVAFGYSNPPPGAPGRGTLVVVEEEAAAVRRVFALAAAGGGDHAIANQMNALGIPAPRGGAWGKTTVRRTLTNPAYIGVQASGVWVAEKGSRTFRYRPDNPRAVLVEGAHPAIIERAVWDAVHGRAKLPRTAVPRVLTGLLHAGGRRLGSDTCDGVACYRWPRGERGGPWLESAPLEGAVWDAFVSLATGPELVARLMEAAAGPTERAALEQESAYLEDRVRKLERRLAGLVGMLADGDIDRPTFHSRRDETEAELKGLRAELAGVRARAASCDGTQAARVAAAVKTLLGGRASLSGPQKRAVLLSIVRRIDLETARVGGDFNRDERGRVLPGRAARWSVTRIGFTLALGDAGPRGVPEPGGAGGGGAGRSDAASWDCAQAPATAGANGHGRLGTTSLCSAPRGPARP